MALDPAVLTKRKARKTYFALFLPAYRYIICPGDFEYLKEEIVTCLYGLHQMVGLKQLEVDRARAGMRKLGLLPW